MQPDLKMAAGSIVQIDPENSTNTMFGGCLLVVTEVKSWGVQGYVQCFGEDGVIGRQAYFRPRWEDIEPTGGKAAWWVE